MKIFSEKNIGKLIILNSSLIGLLMWLGIVAHTFWDSNINLAMELAQMEQDHIKAKKESVSQAVQDFIYSMDNRRQTVLNMLQFSLEQQVRQIRAMAEHTWKQNKSSTASSELEKMIIEAIRPVKFNNDQSWFFIRTMSGTTKLWPPDPKQEGKNVYDHSDEGKLHALASIVATARKGGGFCDYLWPKPGGEAGKSYQKIAYVTYFAPFDWYIGAGAYLDEVEQSTQQQVINIINQHADRSEDEYMFILDLHNIKGGEQVAAQLKQNRGSSQSDPDPLNRVLDSGYQDPAGRQFRESFINGISEYGEVFVKYQDKQPGSDETRPKMTYFKLYPKWDWIVARGFYYDDLQAQINAKKEQHRKMFREKIRISLAIFCFILLGALCISLLFSHKVRALFFSYQQRLEESNRELVKARDSAHAATLAKSEFLANMSHEIRTPMNGIINLAELALETELSAKQADYLQKILFSSKSLLDIINDILDFSKIEAGMLKLERIHFDLPGLFERLMLMFSEHSLRKNIPLRLSLSPDLPEHVTGDPVRLHQVLSNLIGNAIKFTEAGEIMVRATAIQKTAERAVIQFSVADTGIGIPAEKTALLFESFTQADSSTARKYGGTGLGLTISKRLVELMGGQLGVESEVGVGSVFSFVLEFVLNGLESKAGSADGKDELAAAIARLRNARILVVEDNAINQQVAQEILTKAGLRAELVSNGAEAVAAVAQQDFDAVLMDVQMPIMDGYEATRQIRQDLGKTDLPILAMTAHAVSEERDKCFRMGMDDHIAKPFSRRSLFLTLSRWIAKADSRAGKQAAAEQGSSASPLLGRLFLDPSRPAGLDLAEGLQRLEGNEQLHLKLLKSFCREQKEMAARIERIIREHDYSAAKYIAHTLKGVAGNIGMPAIQSLAGRTESELNTGSLQQAEALLRRLAEQVSEAVSYLDRHFSAEEETEEQTAIPQNFDRKEALLTLQQLAPLLEQADFSVLQFAEEHQNVIRLILGGQPFAELMTLLEGFKFEEALNLIQTRLKNGEDDGTVG